jgi:hypothetical protein
MIYVPAIIIFALLQAGLTAFLSDRSNRIHEKNLNQAMQNRHRDLQNHEII